MPVARLATNLSTAFAAGASLLMISLSITPAPADAQTVLPGIVVEGATLSKPAKQPTQPETAQPEPQQAAQPAGGNAGASQGQTAAGTFDVSTSVAGTGADADGYDANTIGSSVTVVTSEALANSQIRNTGEALRSLPGVSVSHAGSAAGQTQLRIRGAEANQTLVLIDGIVANQPGTGEFDFSNLPTDQIERIEILRGPQSGLYGSGAIGGVVNVVTKRGSGPPQASVWTEVGSFKTVESGLSVSGGNQFAHGLMSYSVRNSNGFNIAAEGSETDASQFRNFIFKGGITPSKDVSVDVILRNVDKRGDRDNDLLSAPGLSHQIDGPSHFASNLWLAGIEAKHLSFDGRLDQRLRYNYAETVLEDTDDSISGVFYAKNKSVRRNAAYLATWHLGTPAIASVLRHSLTGLVEHETEIFNQITGDNLARERNKIATAGEYRAEIFNRLTVTANVRHDDTDVFKDYTTWRTAASLRIKELGLRPHASYGTGVKLPTMVEQFGQFAGFVPNPDLKAEESEGWDAGLEVTLAKGAIVLDATYFDTNLTNQIVTSYFGLNSTVANLAGESTRKGIELSARWRPASWLAFGANYTWLDAKDSEGRTEQRRPRDSGRIDATLSFAGGRGTLTAIAAYNGRIYDDAPFDATTFQNFRLTLDDYWLATLVARYKLKPGIEIFGRVANAFDAHYQEVYGFETAGIAAYAGMKLTFGGEEPLRPRD